MSRRLNPDKFFPIAGKISKSPFMAISTMSSQIKISRSTISRSIIRMYEEQRLMGPWLSLNPHENYHQIVYFINFSNPLKLFEGLKGFPYILYHAITFGEWNTIIVAEKPMDFSVLKGFQSEIWRGEKGYTYTPPVTRINWDKSWREIKQRLKTISLQPDEPKKTVAVLDWGEKEWNLFHALKFNMRQPMKPVLQDLGIRYDPFSRWKKSLPEHCRIHVEFYPQPVDTYNNHCLLLKSDYIGVVEELFSLLPATPVFIEMSDSVLAYVKTTSCMTKNLIDVVFSMKERGIIEDVHHAVVFDEYRLR